MKKHYLLMLILMIQSMLLVSQELIDVSDINPLLKSAPRFRKAFLHDNKLSLVGNIGFVGDNITPPIVRLNDDGSLDQSFSVDLSYSLDLENELTGPSTYLNDFLFVTSTDGLLKIGNSGESEVFELSVSNLVNDISPYGDSLLVLSRASELNLYSMDGNHREIDTDLDETYFLLSIYELSDSTFLLLCQDRETAEFEFYLFEDGIESMTFDPFTVDQPGNIRKIELMSTGEIFIVGQEISVNSTPGNGIYIINSQGAISNNSFHENDLAFINAYGNGIRTATVLSDGKIIVVGQSDEDTFLNFSIGRLLPDGSRDDTFVSKQFLLRDSNVEFFLISDLQDDIYLISDFYEFDGNEVTGVVKFDSNGNLIESFNAEIGGNSEFNSLEVFNENELLVVGSFTDSKYSETPFVSAFSINSVQDYAWLDAIDLTPDDIIGTAKILSNGDVFVGAFNRGFGQIIQVLSENGDALANTLDAFALSVERPIYDVYEDDDFIYATGALYYSPDSPTKYGVLQLDKNYSIVETFNPVSITSDMRVAASYLSEEGLIVQVTDIQSEENLLFRLLSDGSKDLSFPDISLDGQAYFSRPGFKVAGDSLLFIQTSDFNNPQYVDIYNLSGELLVDDFITLNSDSRLTDVELINDSTFLISGSFKSINGVPRAGLAVVSSKGAVYDDLSLDISGEVGGIAIIGDTLFVVGPGSIEGENGGGFYGVSLETPKVEIDGFNISPEGYIEVSWEANPSVRGYELVRTDESQNSVSLAEVGKGSISYIDESALPNIEYTYKLISKNVFGSDFTESSFKIIKPENPDGLNSAFADGDVNLSWNDNSSVETGIEVYRSVDGGEFELLTALSADETSFVDAEIEIDHFYSYYLKALSENYFSDNSDTTSVSVFRPSSPDDLTYEYNYDAQELTISWIQSGELADEFIVYEALIDDTAFDAIDTLNGDVFTYFKILETSLTYHYYITGINEVGESDQSETISLNTIPLDAEIKDFGLLIYPNPAESNFRIHVENVRSMKELIVMDANGKIIISKKLEANEVEVHLNHSGVYLFRFLGEGGSHTRRVIVR